MNTKANDTQQVKLLSIQPLFLQDKGSNKIYGTKHISPTPLLEAGEKTLCLSENPFVRR